MGLNVDTYYYNDLHIEGFSKMMKDPSFCYKFYWLEAIVNLISEGKKEASYDEIIDEMIANAWYSVLQFHIHLSGLSSNGEIKDNLERAVIKLNNLSNLKPNSSKIEVKNEIKSFNQELHSEKMDLTKNVPYKALSGFANIIGEKVSLDNSAGRMMEYYNSLNSLGILMPYTFGKQKGLDRRIYFSDSWIKMIQDNTFSIMGWIQNEKVKWLQNNNPEIPGLIYKLVPLDEKMRKLSNVRNLWTRILEKTDIVDVFNDELVESERFDVDHFIPWSFVMNDELWNLMPIDPQLNSSKGNRLPEWDKFFSRFAGNQYVMYEMLHKDKSIHKLYEFCFKDNLHSIWACQELYRKGNSKIEFSNILEKNMRPVYDSAKRQGYDLWRR